ncbi:MAG: hypothetical protein HY700_21800 [Gemmatimonadetes bacterium]|nr:hypothetical protein [Gemmatimonadota bacterium]
MPLIPFEKLPDDARLWVFPCSRRLSESEVAKVLEPADRFLSGWAAHGVPLAAARDWRFNQFLFVGVDEAAAGTSGCSIDALVRAVGALEPQLGATLTANSPVWFRGADGAVRCVTRDEFQKLADQGTVEPDTLVFDNTIQTVGALRDDRWETPAKRAWHGSVFFAAVGRGVR